jgi:hypothetical protein
MAFRQVREEEERRTTIAMRYARRFPKLLNSPEEFSWAWGKYLSETGLDPTDGLRLLAEADSLIRVEIPDQVLSAYMSLDWSVLPRRTAIVLMVLLDMQRTEGVRLIADTRKIIRRAELIENDLVGWKHARGAWSPKVVMDAYARLQSMGLLDELIPGDSGKPSEWDEYYRRKGEGRDATIVRLTRHPEQPTVRVRGHARPSVWSVAVGSYLASDQDITPAITQTPRALAVGYTGRAVCDFETQERDDPDRVLTLEDLRQWDSYESTMERARVWFRTQGNLADFTG